MNRPVRPLVPWKTLTRSSATNMTTEQTTEEFKFPELTVMLSGSSGIEIRAVLTQKYDCVEFTLNANPQPIFISPWMQFEPSAMSDERARIAHEIVHRAVNYQRLLKEVTGLKESIGHMHDREDRFRNQRDKTFDMWKADRKRMGLPEDFSDITEWPPEMMSQYV